MSEAYQMSKLRYLLNNMFQIFKYKKTSTPGNCYSLNVGCYISLEMLVEFSRILSCYQIVCQV